MKKRRRKMNVFDRNQLKVARETLKMPNALVEYFGLSDGMTKEYAKQVISKMKKKYGEGE